MLRAPGFRARLGLAAVWSGLVFLLFPGVSAPVGPGLDPSWMWAINALPYTGRLPGRDVVFNYGPLGWLLIPAAVGDNAMWGLLFRVVLHALFAVGLFRALRGVPAARAFVFAGLFLMSFLLGLSPEGRLILTVALLLAPDLQEPLRIPWAPAVAGALAALFLLIKLDFGVTAALLVASFCALLLLRRGPGWGRSVLAAAAGFAAVALAAVPLLFGAPRYALLWLGLESEIVRGYAAAMKLPMEVPDFVAGLLAFAAFAGLCLWTRRSGAGAADFWTMLLLPAWLAFQHGFIRSDIHHTAAFFPFLIATVALGLLFAGEPQLRAVGGVTIVLLLLTIPFAVQSMGPAMRSGIDLVLGIRGWDNLRAAVQPGELERSLERRQRRRLKPMRLPRELVRPIRQADLGVDVLPWELSYLAANDLRWVPNPTFQLHATFTPRLDAMAAEHFAGPGSPDLLFVDYTGIDDRDMLWDSPATWRSILAHYEPDPDRQGPFLVARRRRRPLSWQLGAIGEARVRPHQWIEVPRTAPGDWLFAEIHFEPSFRGRMERLLLGVLPVYVETLDDLGRRRVARVLTDTSGEGLLLSPAPRNIGELNALWKGEPVGRTLRFRIGGPGRRSFQEEIRVRWVSGQMK